VKILLDVEAAFFGSQRNSVSQEDAKKEVKCMFLAISYVTAIVEGLEYNFRAFSKSFHYDYYWGAIFSTK